MTLAFRGEHRMAARTGKGARIKKPPRPETGRARKEADRRPLENQLLGVGGRRGSHALLGVFFIWDLCFIVFAGAIGASVAAGAAAGALWARAARGERAMAAMTPMAAAFLNIKGPLSDAGSSAPRLFTKRTCAPMDELGMNGRPKRRTAPLWPQRRTTHCGSPRAPDGAPGGGSHFLLRLAALHHRLLVHRMMLHHRLLRRHGVVGHRLVRHRRGRVRLGESGERRERRARLRGWRRQTSSAWVSPWRATVGSKRFRATRRICYRRVISFFGAVGARRFDGCEAAPVGSQPMSHNTFGHLSGSPLSARATGRGSAASSTAARRACRSTSPTSRPSSTGAGPGLRVSPPSGASRTRRASSRA